MRQRYWWHRHSLLAATLLLTGAFPLAAPAFADGTKAGTKISNTAKATYQDANITDPNAPGGANKPFNATSNEVQIIVAEVAGITVIPLAVTDTNGGTLLPNDVVNYDYKVTNVGNDTTRFFIPGRNNVKVNGPGDIGTVEVVGYVKPDGTSVSFAQPFPVPATGADTQTLTVAGNNLAIPVGTGPATYPNGIIPAGYSLIVRVPITVQALAPSGASIETILGDTGNNDNTATTQNQGYVASTTRPNSDVYTVDGADGTPTDDEADGPPSNGQREASASQTITVGSQPQAFATVLKTRTNYQTQNTTPLNDDELTYSLSLRVDSTAPTGSTGLTPADLVGTSMTVDGSSVTRILISDAIPTQTTLKGAPSISASGWTAVYTASTNNADQAPWYTNVNDPMIGGLNNVKRVGFIHAGPIQAGNTVSGFSFTVVTSGVTSTTTIANIAQLFGRTKDGGTTLVYDESGDQSPSNFNDNGTPGSNAPTNGIANPSQDGIDNQNDNTGSGIGGEDNVFTIAAPGAVLNGPNGQPSAMGPTSNNDDFTNKSTEIPEGTKPNDLIDPLPVTFTNTINNPSTTADLTNLLLVPHDGANTGTIPTNTIVKLTYGTQTATYEYNGNDFIFKSGSTILIPTLTPGTSINYTVEVDLPNGTALSTDTGNGYPVTIYAFKDVDGDGRPSSTTTEPTQNATIDRVYTGFLQLDKQVSIYDTNGTTLIEGPTKTPTTQNIQKGRFIEYQITFTNISTPAAGAGNVILNASNVAITEDGVSSPTNPNNWADDQDGNGIIDTSNVVGQASGTYDSIANVGTVTYSPSGDQSGTTVANDVTRYVYTPGVLIQPQKIGTFRFRRKIN